MQKEILTKEKIEQEVAKRYINIKPQAALLILVGFLCAAIILAIHSLQDFRINIPLICLFVLVVFLIYIGFWTLFDSFKKRKMMNNGNFYITTDKVYNTKKKYHYFSRHRPVDYFLYFEKHGEYIIPMSNYECSEMFSMSDTGLYRYSEIGDEFYLIMAEGKKEQILLVYNKKMFELQK